MTESLYRISKIIRGVISIMKEEIDLEETEEWNYKREWHKKKDTDIVQRGKVNERTMKERNVKNIISKLILVFTRLGIHFLSKALVLRLLVRIRVACTISLINISLRYKQRWIMEKIKSNITGKKRIKGKWHLDIKYTESETYFKNNWTKMISIWDRHEGGKH